MRTLKELEIVSQQLTAAREASEAGSRLAEHARTAAVNPPIAPDRLERSYASRLRAPEIEQTLIELQIALAVASGVDVR